MSRGTAGKPARPDVTLLAEAFSETLAGLQARSVRALREEVWARRQRPFWRTTPAAYRALGRTLGGRGENFSAIEVATEGLAWFPRDPELIHLRGLAYARTGASDTAGEHAQRLLGILAEEAAEGGGDEARAIHWEVEARTLQARNEKDRAAAAATGRERTGHLQASLACYETAYQCGERGQAEEEKYYPAINAAAVAAELGDRERVTRYAALARTSCQRALRLGGGDPYWPAATLAECALLLGEADEAVADLYRRAAALAPRDWAKQNATRRQARTLRRVQGRPPEGLDGCFALPRVVLFAGHLTDGPDRAVPRFPEAAAARIGGKIVAFLEGAAPRGGVPLIGFASAARGGDLLFLEALRARGDEFHVVLPCAVAPFRACSVETPGATNGWGERFDRLLEAAASVWSLPAAPGKMTAEQFAYGNQMLHGLALQKAREFELDDAHLRTLAVWDGQPGDGGGGTASCVRSWRARGHAPFIIHPGPEEAGETLENPGGEPAAAKMTPTDALLVGEFPSATGEAAGREKIFAHAAARLREPAFAAALVGAPTVEEGRFCLVFRSADAAARLASALQAWAGLHGPEAGLRQGLHAGPVMRRTHPLSGRTEPVGAHRGRAEAVCRAVGAGQVGTSREFAALLATEGSALRCDYLGLGTAASDGELQALYTLRRPDAGAAPAAVEEAETAHGEFC